MVADADAVADADVDTNSNTIKSHLFIGGFYHLIEKLNATFVFLQFSTPNFCL